MGAHRYSGPRHARPTGPRHAKPTQPGTAHRTVALTGLATALVAAESFGLSLNSGSAGAVTPDRWAQLRMCEASGNYGDNTGNGYYGAYQFDLKTWHGLGYPGLPSAAPAPVQDQAAQQLYATRGWEPWPSCSLKLGLVDDRQASRSDARLPLAPVVVPLTARTVVSVVRRTPVAAKPVTSTPVPRTSTPVPRTSTPVPRTSTPIPRTAAAPVARTVSAAPVTRVGWDGHYLTTRDVVQARTDVTLWQRQMRAAGYPLTVDGRYGPASAAAASRFEAAKGLPVETPGVVGPRVWSALFAK